MGGGSSNPNESNNWQFISKLSRADIIENKVKNNNYPMTANREQNKVIVSQIKSWLHNKCKVNKGVLLFSICHFHKEFN